MNNIPIEKVIHFYIYFLFILGMSMSTFFNELYIIVLFLVFVRTVCSEKKMCRNRDSVT